MAIADVVSASAPKVRRRRRNLPTAAAALLLHLLLLVPASSSAPPASSSSSSSVVRAEGGTLTGPVRASSGAVAPPPRTSASASASASAFAPASPSAPSAPSTLQNVRHRPQPSGAAEGLSNARRTPSSGATAAGSRTTTTPNRGSGGSDIVFPDSQYRPRFSGRKPTCAREGATFCEDGVEGYPTGHLNQILENTVGFREYFGNDSFGQNLVDRFGHDGETTICPSKEQLIFPKMGQNSDGDWVYIVNLDSNFQQGIRVEVCEKSDQPCVFANALPGGVNAVCRQKYIYRRLVAVGEGGEAKPDSFRLPSCCACFINSEVTARILSGDAPRTSKRRRRHHLQR